MVKQEHVLPAASFVIAVGVWVVLSYFDPGFSLTEGVMGGILTGVGLAVVFYFGYR